MCDQTEVIYNTGDVVWVKLGPVWWPGQVQDYDALPEEITSNLRKKPIAVVKFFQEETFEYVKNLNHIYQYNCRKKEEFIKKGLDMVRSSNSRDVPSNMKMFPEDIVMAEHITGGDPNILNNEKFAPEQKSDYSDLFGAKKSPSKKGRSDSKKDSESWKSRKSSLPFKNGRHSLPILPSNIPRPITHPRFLTKALEGKSDHEIRIRCQISNRRDYEDKSPLEKVYNCHLCEFHTSRLNVIVLHNKSHSAGFIEAQNTIRSKLKSRERELFSSTPLIDQTPKIVSSRGRVKSVPKKLMDYTDEPPTKIFKDKVYSKSVNKEEKTEPPIKSTSPKSPNKTPKKEKDVEKTSIKRPLFGKRKTAKEKAELAAKQKQENEAMKETLLKDWDDDDIMQGEVELDKLMQALEGTTTSNVEFEDSNISGTESLISTPTPEPVVTKEKTKPVVTKDKTKPLVTKDKMKPVDNKISDIDINKDIKAKVFEFDDSEDSLPVTNFRLKNQREKFTDDKFKKPKPPKPLSKIVPKSKTSKMSLSPVSKPESDKEADEFNLAFDSLLEETSVPILPEIPKTGSLFSAPTGETIEQTSDISSSTDLVKDFNIVEESDVKINNEELQNDIPNSELISTEPPSECTSSDSEDQVSEPLMHSQNMENIPLKGEQKNLNEVSASDPSVEMDLDLSLPGVATTTTDSSKCSTPLISLNETSTLKEDLSMTEISSTCDIAKSDTEEPKQIVKDDLQMKMKELQTEKESEILQTETISNELEETCFQIGTEEDNTTTEKLKFDTIMQDSEPEILEICTTYSDTTIIEETNIKPINENVIAESIVKTENENVTTNNHLQCAISEQDMVETPQTDYSLDHSDLIVEENKIDHHKEEFLLPSNDNKEVLDEELVKHNEVSIRTEEVISTQSNIIPTSSTQSVSIENLVDVPMLMPIDTVSKSNSLTSSQPILSADIKEELGSVENKEHPQNLQDMELDINSMPVIIGGEDFVQPEEPKQNFVSIEPSFSESIVISPTVTPSPKKTESVIMHLGEPSTSNKKVQPVISVPSKNVKSGGRGGRSQKGTSKTIKLSASTLKNLGALQKGGNQQVLILKTASSGKDKSDKASLQKHKGQLNMFQHGDKILIVNNAQMSGQNKIKLNPQQQQLLTGGKLAPGTRVITSKVVATTSSQGTESSSKMTISKSSTKPTQKLVISKGGLLSGTSKSVIINSSKLISSVPGAHTLTTSKGQTLITHNLINTKSGLILPSPAQGTATSSQTAAIITSQALSPNKGMILAPITSKGGTIISGNQKLRIVSSKAPLSGTRLVVKNTPGGKLKVDPQNKGQQVKLISGLRGQPSGNTILIQTSQGLVAKTISSNTPITAGIQSPIRAKPVVRTVMTTIPTQTKIRTATVQQPAVMQQTPVKKVTAPKAKQSPNILQKSTRKSTPRAPKSTANRLISPAVSHSEPLILSPATGLSNVNQPTLIQGQLPQSSDGLLYLTVDETGNCRQLDNKSMISFEGNPEAPQTIFIPASAQNQDVSNIYFAIDDAGNIVNITQPATSTTVPTENVAPGQDILAKALENTQVLQQETIIPDIDVTSALASSSIGSPIICKSYSDQANYPAPSLSHSVLETSLTLNQPIMTPLEVPSAVSPNIGQLSSLSSNFISSNLITTKQKHMRPSMPLLTEESLANQTGSEPVFLLDASNNIIPATSGSQISFQLLDDNNVIMTSGTDSAVIPSSYQVVSGDLLATQITNPVETNTSQSMETSGENVTYSILSQDDQVQSEMAQSVQQSIILREALECSQANIKTDQFLNSVKEVPQNDSVDNLNQSQDGSSEHCIEENPNIIECNSEQLNLSYENQEIVLSQPTDDAKHSLKRSFGEEQTVTSSSDLERETKRVRIDER